jgi:hypothetical protein
MFQRTRRLLGFGLEVYDVHCDLKKTRGVGTAAGVVPVLLPHEVLHTLHKHGKKSHWAVSVLGFYRKHGGFLKWWDLDKQHHPDHPVHALTSECRHKTIPVINARNICASPIHYHCRGFDTEIRSLGRCKVLGFLVVFVLVW